jgi:hypothetical protein
VVKDCNIVPAATDEAARTSSVSPQQRIVSAESRNENSKRTEQTLPLRHLGCSHVPRRAHLKIKPKHLFLSYSCVHQFLNSLGIMLSGPSPKARSDVAERKRTHSECGEFQGYEADPSQESGSGGSGVVEKAAKVSKDCPRTFVMNGEMAPAMMEVNTAGQTSRKNLRVGRGEKRSFIDGSGPGESILDSLESEGLERTEEAPRDDRDNSRYEASSDFRSIGCFALTARAAGGRMEVVGWEIRLRNEAWHSRPTTRDRQCVLPHNVAPVALAVIR